MHKVPIMSEKEEFLDDIRLIKCEANYLRDELIFQNKNEKISLEVVFKCLEDLFNEIVRVEHKIKGDLK